MAQPLKPQKTTVYGNRRVWLVDTIADPSAPTAIEINAGEYLSCYPVGELGGPTSTPNKVTLDAVLCETESEEDFGTTVHSHPDMSWAYDPQAAEGSPGKKAWDLLKAGWEGFIVHETGIRADDDDQVVAGEFVTVVPSKQLVVSEDPSSSGESGIAAFQTSVVVRSPYTQRNVAVVAVAP